MCRDRVCSPRRCATLQDVRPLIDRHYSIERVREMELYHDEASRSEEQPGSKKRAYLRGMSSNSQHTFSIALITCALGKQLLLERAPSVPQDL